MALTRTEMVGLMTHAEIAKVLGCSHTTVQNIEKAALEKLRRNPVIAEFGIVEREPNYYQLLEENALGFE